ncbi:FAD-dependent oxidoreductase [Nonomuraea fuscirosea]|uniref:FAD-dependent oxidoreductase n=1 Tax=Nonomuraea fuscirosea TaxID=1291556 RepID=UPI0034124D63
MALCRSTHEEQVTRQEQHMKHRIVVLGAGYAGVYVAGNLVRRLSAADVQITVVNAVPDFVERLRLHQVAAGRTVAAQRLDDVFAGTGIRLRVARVSAVDPERQVVAVADAEGGGELGHDTLVYARSGFKPTPAKRRLAGGTSAVHYARVNGAPALVFVVGDRASATLR